MPDYFLEPSPHVEAADVIRKKGVVSREVFDQLLPELKARALLITGIEHAGALQDIRDRIAEVPEGALWDDVKGDIAETISAFFWKDGMDREEYDKLIAASERRAELLLRMNANQAYAVAQWRMAQETKDTHPFFEYATIGDNRVREAHEVLDGIVLPVDHPFWDSHYPPWDWGCRCQLIQIGDATMESIRKEDEQRPIDERKIIEGERLKKLEREGKLAMGPNNIVDVRSAEERGDENGFRSGVKDMRIPLEKLRGRYDEKTWADFKGWAKNTKLEDELVGGSDQSLLAWLEGRDFAEWVKPAGASLTSRITNKPVAKKVQQAIEAAGKLHGVTTLSKGRIEGIHSGSTLGQYHYKKPVKIDINVDGPWPRLTALHELGHMIADQGLHVQWRIVKGVIPDELQQWYKAVTESRAYQKLLESANNPHYQYLLNPSELWARSYAQYIAVEWGSAEVLAELNILNRVSETGRQWEKEEFEPIRKTITELFRMRGW